MATARGSRYCGCYNDYKAATPGPIDAVEFFHTPESSMRFAAIATDKINATHSGCRKTASVASTARPTRCLLERPAQTMRVLVFNQKHAPFDNPKGRTQSTRRTSKMAECV